MSPHTSQYHSRGDLLQCWHFTCVPAWPQMSHKHICHSLKREKSLGLYTNQVANAYLQFQNNEVTRSISTSPPPPLDRMLVHRRVTPRIKFAGTHLYTWVERGTVRVKCLAQDHNTMSPARARTWTARSGGSHKATVPPPEKQGSRKTLGKTEATLPAAGPVKANSYHQLNLSIDSKEL